MEEQTLLLSLCIPTNGKSDWVIPVVDSILCSAADEKRYEIVIEDNGEGHDLETKIRDYQTDHRNIRYYRSASQGFLCQIDCLRHADGQLIKFVNHRSMLVEGAVEYLLQYAAENLQNKPVTFFSNGKLGGGEFENFDQFVRGMSFWSSWSGGLAIWRNDQASLSNDRKYNTLFPHTDLLFRNKNAGEYRIVDRELFSDIVTGHASKGKYNVFRAFAVEYLSIINDLLRNNDIQVDTFLSVRKELLPYLTDLYVRFITFREPASYDFTDCKKYLGVYYSDGEFRNSYNRQVRKTLLKKIRGRFIK